MSLSRISSSVARNLTRSLAGRSSLMMSKSGAPALLLIRPAVRDFHLISGSNNGHKCTANCLCGNSRRGVADNAIGLNNRGDKELTDFLADEIRAEKKTTKVPKHGPGVPGFDVQANGSNIKLTRKVNDEVITVKFNVNGTVDTEGPEEEGQEPNIEKGQQPDVGDMISRPEFTVEIKKPHGKSLVFSCRLLGDEDTVPDEYKSEEDKGDQFEIESFGILNKDDVDELGEWDENVYLGDGRIIDGQLYDLLMNYLDERGIGIEFADHLAQYSTHYEHGQYVNLLENVKNFVEGK